MGTDGKSQLKIQIQKPIAK